MNLAYCNPGHNILELYYILVQARFTTFKTELDISSITNLVYHELQNVPNLRKLGNIRKPQIWAI